MSSFQEYVKKLGFDVEKYNVFESFGDFDLIAQLRIREQYSNVIKGLTGEDEYCFAAYVMGDDLDKIYNMDPDSQEFKDFSLEKMLLSLNDTHEYYKGCFNNPIISDDDKFINILSKIPRQEIYGGFVPNMLSFSDIVKPFSRHSMEGFIYDNPTIGAGIEHSLFFSQDEIEDLDCSGSEKLFVIANESVSLVSPEKMKSPNNFEDFLYTMHLSIDIAKHDKEILDDLARLLPIWRKELNIGVPEKKRGWGYIRGKILTYKILPLIDLLELAKVYTFINKKRVPKRIISLLLYPNGERDGFGLEQTILPFLEKIKGKSYRLLTDYKINKE